MIRGSTLQAENLSAFIGLGPRQFFALSNLANRYVAVTGGYIDSKS